MARGKIHPALGSAASAFGTDFVQLSHGGIIMYFCKMHNIFSADGRYISRNILSPVLHLGLYLQVAGTEVTEQ